MRILVKQLLGLPVYTESETHLGEVVDAEYDIDQQCIMIYHVKPATVLATLFGAKLLVDRSQVVSITADKMIVQDAVETEAAAVRAAAKGKAAAPSVAISRQSDSL